MKDEGLFQLTEAEYVTNVKKSEHFNFFHQYGKLLNWNRHDAKIGPRRLSSTFNSDFLSGLVDTSEKIQLFPCPNSYCRALGSG